MGFNDSAINYFYSQDHKDGDDLEFCKNYFNNRKFEKLLDIASAAGHFTKPFNTEFKVAADLSLNMLKIAKTKNDIKHLIAADAENLPFKANTFDIVTCRIAMHHFKSPAKFFREVYRLLKKDGFFVLIDSIVDIDDTFLNKIERIRDKTHIRSLTVKEILDIAKDFRLLTFHTIFKKHDFMQWATRLKGNDNIVPQIEKAFLDLPENIKNELKVEIKNAKVVSYTDKKGIFIFRKISA
jgi:SAM-dependent methyltransferase